MTRVKGVSLGVKMVYFAKDGIFFKYSSFSTYIANKRRQDIVSHLQGISSRDINDSVRKKITRLS